MTTLTQQPKVQGPVPGNARTVNGNGSTPGVTSSGRTPEAKSLSAGVHPASCSTPEPHVLAHRSESTNGLYGSRNRGNAPARRVGGQHGSGSGRGGRKRNAPGGRFTVQTSLQDSIAQLVEENRQLKSDLTSLRNQVRPVEETKEAPSLSFTIPTSAPYSPSTKSKRFAGWLSMSLRVLLLSIMLLIAVVAVPVLRLEVEEMLASLLLALTAISTVAVLLSLTLWLYHYIYQSQNPVWEVLGPIEVPKADYRCSESMCSAIHRSNPCLYRVKVLGEDDEYRTMVVSATLFNELNDWVSPFETHTDTDLYSRVKSHHQINIPNVALRLSDGEVLDLSNVKADTIILFQLFSAKRMELAQYNRSIKALSQRAL